MVGKPQWSRTPSWTDVFESPCSFDHQRLYCFSTVVTLFWDGFEGGNAARWSNAVP